VAGFTGSHLCERLFNDRHLVTAVDSFSTGRAWNLVNLKGADNFTRQLINGIDDVKKGILGLVIVRLGRRAIS
jgi:nucleoside-diphosphate-sugar epimerase